MVIEQKNLQGKGWFNSTTQPGSSAQKFIVVQNCQLLTPSLSVEDQVENAAWEPLVLGREEVKGYSPAAWLRNNIWKGQRDL